MLLRNVGMRGRVDGTRQVPPPWLQLLLGQVAKHRLLCRHGPALGVLARGVGLPLRSYVCTSAHVHMYSHEALAGKSASTTYTAHARACAHVSGPLLRNVGATRYAITTHFRRGLLCTLRSVGARWWRPPSCRPGACGSGMNICAWVRSAACCRTQVLHAMLWAPSALCGDYTLCRYLAPPPSVGPLSRRGFCPRHACRRGPATWGLGTHVHMYAHMYAHALKVHAASCM